MAVEGIVAVTMRNGENPVSGRLFFFFFNCMPAAFQFQSVGGKGEGDQRQEWGEECELCLSVCLLVFSFFFLLS